MYFETFPVGRFQCNCSIIADENSGEAIVVDPGDEADRILEKLKENGFTVKYLVHTHAHIDHICATKDIQDQTQAELCLHKGDLPLYENINVQGQFLGLPGEYEINEVTQFLEDDDDIALARLHMKVLHTPGHTPGSVCFLMKDVTLGDQTQNLLFSGDTLFYHSIGRTDLWGGDYEQIQESIKNRLLTLDQSTIVIPGHGMNTTIGREGSENPFVKK